MAHRTRCGLTPESRPSGPLLACLDGHENTFTTPDRNKDPSPNIVLLQIRVLLTKPAYFADYGQKVYVHRWKEVSEKHGLVYLKATSHSYTQCSSSAHWIGDGGVCFHEYLCTDIEMYDVEPDHTQLKLLVKAGLVNPGFSRGKEIPEQDETGLEGRVIDGCQDIETREGLP
jgi:hypothetical protein